MIVDPKIYQAIVVAKALRFYAKTGMKVNTAYTPKNMMATAARITGETYKARDYIGAAEDLEAWAHNPVGVSQ